MLQEYFEKVDDAFGSIMVDPKWKTFMCNGIKMLGVNKLVQSYIPEFDAQGVSMAMAKGDEQKALALQAEWERSKKVSCALGNCAHLYLEARMQNKYGRYAEEVVNEEFPHAEDASAREEVRASFNRIVTQVDSFREQIRGRLVPVGSEVVIGSPKYMVCGIVDQIFWNRKAQELQIWDWKTNGKFRLNNEKAHFKAPLMHLDDCEYVKYSMQLSAYKRIFTEETGIPVGQCYLCWFSSAAPTQQMFPIRDCSAEVDTILKERAASLGLVDQGSVF